MSKNRSVPFSRIQTFTHQSPIGHWSVCVWQPDPRLAGIVTSMWYGEGKTAYQRDRILPCRQSQLLINLGPPQYRVERGPPEVRVPFLDIWYSTVTLPAPLHARRTLAHRKIQAARRGASGSALGGGSPRRHGRQAVDRGARGATVPTRRAWCCVSR